MNCPGQRQILAKPVSGHYRPDSHASARDHCELAIYGPNWRRDFDAVKAAAGFGGRGASGDGEETKLTPWTVDIMRHTAISHYFRDCGSFGFTAEQFDNSEAIIKAHYKNQTNATSAHTKAFYQLTPATVAKS